MSFSRDSTGRVRAIWRILAFVFVFLGLCVPLELGLRLVEPSLKMTPQLRGIVEGWIFLAAALLATAIMLRHERRDFSMVLLGRSSFRTRALTFGTVAGALTIGVPSLLLWGIGWMVFAQAPTGNLYRAAFIATLFLLPAAFVEELLDRGYPFAVIREAAGPYAAIFFTSAVFGLLHAMNPGANAQSITVVALSGVFLGLLLLVTRSLYAVWMAHFAWNWVMAGLLHTPVSGLNLPTPDYRLIDDGPDWATGGSWGPESGVPAALAMLLVIGFLLRGRRDALFARVSPSPMITPPTNSNA